LGTACVAALIILKIASQIGLVAGKESIGKAMAVLCGVTLLAVTICVLVLCALTLTGPIYKPQLNFSTGDLETYGTIDRFAAFVIASLIIGVVGYVGYRYVLPVG
jgi:branched-subunit amino acid permease